MFCTLAGVIFYVQYSQQSFAHSDSFTSTSNPAEVSNSLALNTVTVGGGSGNAAQTKNGTILKLNSNSLQIKDSLTQNVYTFSVTAMTKVQLLGAFKDQVEYQKELDAYNAQVKVLLQDPIKNKAALAALRLPAAQLTSSITIDDLNVGDSVMVEASSDTANNNYIANIIFKSSQK